MLYIKNLFCRVLKDVGVMTKITLKMEKWLKMGFLKGFSPITPTFFNILQKGFLPSHQ